MSWLADVLRDPAVAGLNMDSGERLAVHAQLLARKRMLRAVFTEFHQLFNNLDQRFFSSSGIRLELGAGVAPIRDSFPDVLATDIVVGKGLDRVLDAENMALDTGSVRSVFGQNCFHHFPHPEKFFHELERVLQPGGGAILLEPWHGPCASLLFKHLFSSEGYDKQFPSWETPASGPMHGANQALSFVVFERDRARFEQLFPTLKIAHQQTCNNYLRYLCSGGLNFRQVFPDFGSPLLRLFEFLLTPVQRLTALHHVIVLRKEA